LDTLFSPRFATTARPRPIRVDNLKRPDLEKDRIDIEMPRSGEKRKKRPKLVPVSEEMRRICEMLARELLRWPDVSMRPMFGMLGVYRGKVVFAMLPDKRALENPRAIAYKRFEAQSKDDEKWKLFELESEERIGSALAHLDRAYTKAAGSTRKEST
jgi:hypothetical protein